MKIITTARNLNSVLAKLGEAKENLQDALSDRLDVDKVINQIIWGESRFLRPDEITQDMKWDAYEANTD